MKRKSPLYIGMFVFLAVLMLGIGYAAISDNLNINGDILASPSDENFNVKFDPTVEPTTTKSRETATVTATVASDLVAKIDVKGLTTTHDTITATYTIKNESAELGASLGVGNIVNSNSDYFEVTANLADNTIAADASTTVTVTVKLIKTPVEQQKAGVTVPITATAVTS